MEISPDSIIFWRFGIVTLNLTLVSTWIVMVLMVTVSWLVTRRMTAATRLTRWQNALEVVVNEIRSQIRGISREEPDRYFPFIATLFLFIAVSNLLTLFPIYYPPTASLSTTAALAICVFVAVPVFGISELGFKSYFKHYLEPTPFMLPFHVLGELSRTLALAVRLFGNVMSGAKVVAILLAVVPLFFPVVLRALGLLTGLIQAYIFAVLAIVYIASGKRAHAGPVDRREPVRQGGTDG